VRQSENLAALRGAYDFQRRGDRALYCTAEPRTALVDLLRACWRDSYALSAACDAYFTAPAPLIWLLGGNSKSLGSSVGWVVLAARIHYLEGLMWIMNRTRKWLFWSGTILEIFLLLTVQTAFIVLVGVRTTQQTVFFTFASSFLFDRVPCVS
jgi:hypothetical protein